MKLLWTGLKRGRNDLRPRRCRTPIRKSHTKGEGRTTESKSRSITKAEKAEHDLKTAKLKKQREARDADEAESKKGKR
jgi:hypothetical protein